MRKYSRDLSPANWPNMALRLAPSGDNFLPNGFKLGDESAVVFGELVLKFFPQMACVGGAVAICADSDLERAAFHNGGNEEITQLGLVNDITEHLKLLTVFVDSAIKVEVIGGSDGKNGLGKVVL